jgi:hypothetical protein
MNESTLSTPLQIPLDSSSSSSKKKFRKKSSWVWNHFKISEINSEAGVIMCKKCNENVTYDGSGPTPLAYHLNARHEIYKHTTKVNSSLNNENTENGIMSDSDSEFSDIEDSDGDHDGAPPIKKVKVERVKMIHDKLLDFVIATDQPFSVVNNQEFKDFVKSMNPSYKLPCKTTLTDTLLPEKVILNINSVFL